MSTARMGAGSGDQRVRSDGAVRGTVGLYVADAAPLPDLGRRQSDDDDHRLLPPHVARAWWRCRGLSCFINGQHKRRLGAPSPALRADRIPASRGSRRK